MPQGTSAVAAIMPVRTPPPVRHDWQAMGLPESGWLLIIDRGVCKACAALEAPPCVAGCISAHGLPRATRVGLGSCAQCDPAPCREACPADAIMASAEGVVEIDQEVCIGCRFCMDACPNGALMYIDPYQAALPPHGLPRYSAGEPTGALPNTVAKCTLCSSRMLNGQMPVCAEECPEQAVWVGNLDRNTATDGRRITRLADLLMERPFTVPAPGPRVVWRE